MSEAKGQQEPSMEEILASIRRIIAEDEPAKPPIEVEMAAPAPPEEEDILELTEIVADEPPEAEPEPYRPPPRSRMPDPPPMDDRDDRDHLVSAGTAAASAAAFSEITSRLRERRSSEVFLGNGAVTIEEIVRDLLKPMLREWLDENLPSLVERLVHEEIKRLAREAL
jgi:uncharacterized protein